MTEWTSVEERMPEHEGAVIGYRDYGDGTTDYWICMISTTTGQFVRQTDAEVVSPTHWMPLPEPPEN